MVPGGDVKSSRSSVPLKTLVTKKGQLSESLSSAAVRVPLVPQLLLLPFWPVKIFCPSRTLTAGAKEKFLQERVAEGSRSWLDVDLPGRLLVRVTSSWRIPA
jgi:hypothetical protein